MGTAGAGVGAGLHTGLVRSSSEALTDLKMPPPFVASLVGQPQECRQPGPAGVTAGHCPHVRSLS